MGMHVFVSSGDLEAVMAQFSEESVMTDHPAAPKLTGLAQIRLIQAEEDMGHAAAENAYTISNVEVAGDAVTWDQVRVSDRG